MWSGSSVVFFESVLKKGNGFRHVLGIELDDFENQEDKKKLWHVKVLFVVPKRLISSASLRNKVKRRLFEVYRLRRAEIENAVMLRHSSVDGVVVCVGIFYKVKRIVSFQTLQNEFEVFLKKIVR